MHTYKDHIIQAVSVSSSSFVGVQIPEYLAAVAVLNSVDVDFSVRIVPSGNVIDCIRGRANGNHSISSSALLPRCSKSEYTLSGA